MITQETSDVSTPRKRGIPRRLALVVSPLVFLVAIPLVHGVVPWALSLLGTWYGWEGGKPAVWNLFGLVLVSLGILILLWLMIFGFTQLAQVPERVEVNWEPKLLMTRGPYAYSRHPMYVAELSLWLGWAVLFGSVIVLVGFVVFCVAASILAAHEERALEAKFGKAYCQYRARVPRWLGIPREESVTGRA